MRLTRAEVVALLKDIGEPPGKELEYRAISGAIEATACMYSDFLPENVESIRAWLTLRESLFWARRSLGLEHALGLAGLESVEGPSVPGVTSEPIDRGNEGE